MVWTKDDVDKYVTQVESNCKNAREVGLISKLCFGSTFVLGVFNGWFIRSVT